VGHNQLVRSRLPVVGVLVVVLLTVNGCSGESDAPEAPLAFCKATAEYDHRLSTDADVPLRVHLRLVGDIVEAAPRSVADDARAFLDALEAVRTDPSVRDDPDVKRAVENVNRYAAQGCDFYARRSGI
jgi:hypothetical protein